jgi:hypothetical protein
MSLTTNENKSVTLSKDRHAVCLEAAWELEALAFVLPEVANSKTVEDLNSGFVVRCIASRIRELSNALMAGLMDDAETVERLERKVLVTRFEPKD